jgi:hypothetical protein
MRLLITEVYKILFRLTGHKAFSLSISLIYITTLNLIVIYGLCVLLKDTSPLAGLALQFFTFNHVLLAAIIMLAIDFWFVLPLRYLSFVTRRHAMTMPLLVYSMISILLIIYFKMF